MEQSETTAFAQSDVETFLTTSKMSTTLARSLERTVSVLTTTTMEYGIMRVKVRLRIWYAWLFWPHSAGEFIDSDKFLRVQRNWWENFMRRARAIIIWIFRHEHVRMSTENCGGDRKNSEIHQVNSCARASDTCEISKKVVDTSALERRRDGSLNKSLTVLLNSLTREWNIHQSKRLKITFLKGKFESFRHRDLNPHSAGLWSSQDISGKTISFKFSSK